MNLKTMGIWSDSATPEWHHTWASTPRVPWHTAPDPCKLGNSSSSQLRAPVQGKVCFQGGRHTSQATAGLEVTHGPAATHAAATICVSVCCRQAFTSTELANTLAVQV